MVFLALVGAVTYAEYERRADWKPSAKLVARIDTLATRIDFPKEFGELTTYERTYWGENRDGQKVVVATFVGVGARAGEDQAFQVVRSRQDADRIGDGGCYKVNIEFDVKTEKLQASCNPELRYRSPH